MPRLDLEPRTIHGRGSELATITSAELAAWRARGAFVDVLGKKIFVVDEGPRDAPPLLLLHGFPTSSFDFVHAVAHLASRHRVVVHDHVGFGLSAKPEGFSYSLLEQADVALAVWRNLGITRGHLLGHDYGTSVVTELCARRELGALPLEIEAITLANGSVHVELAQLAITQKLLKNKVTGPLMATFAGRTVFVRQLRRIFGDPSSVATADLDAAWEALELEDGRHRLAPIASYIEDRYRFWHRWIGALTRLDRPAHVLWGERDPIAVPAIARALARDIRGARLTWLAELGHYPMLEAPRRWSEEVLAFSSAPR